MKVRGLISDRRRLHSPSRHCPPSLFSPAQLLVQRDADLFAENESRETPCDCAEKQHHKELALCLESQMVFSLAPEAEGIEAEYAALDRREVGRISRFLLPLVSPPEKLP